MVLVTLLLKHTQYYCKLPNYRWSQIIDNIDFIDSFIIYDHNTIGSIDTIDSPIFLSNNTFDSIDSIALIR